MHNCIVVGVTGSIAAYKAVEIVSGLVKRGSAVFVVMTYNAQRFVHPVTFRSISQKNVITELFVENENYNPSHVSLAERADLIVVAPATANFIGKVAAGIADDALTCTVMAAKTPVIIAPAMNDSMYLNPIVQQNIKKLKEHGYIIIEPEEGRLCTGKMGKGRLASNEMIVSVILETLKNK
ncbi:flavoprotein [uncultured Candidatus Kuenenia sp.]|jgi:phosphopantothenoylcysteine decarboxylase/phosphopantothenate--cysteine ligase|uniref:flavoprotein n=1 Tax=uncultured Candidatus Kuenenia sp. TaxID=1048336 RepID=UPI001D5CFC90|nr:flavoprotein [uncultured Candidatus Kuenenia sp.]TVM02505.1 MAG: phosphopantothenoylcysteine decarboxylase [Candidatus Kuenenia stuttgartiensis]